MILRRYFCKFISRDREMLDAKHLKRNVDMKNQGRESAVCTSGAGERNDAGFCSLRDLMRRKYRWGDGLPVEIAPDDD
jgi:hypothetical protein